MKAKYYLSDVSILYIKYHRNTPFDGTLNFFVYFETNKQMALNFHILFT